MGAPQTEEDLQASGFSVGAACLSEEDPHA